MVGTALRAFAHPTICVGSDDEKLRGCNDTSICPLLSIYLRL